MKPVTTTKKGKVSLNHRVSTKMKPETKKKKAKVYLNHRLPTKMKPDTKKKMAKVSLNHRVVDRAEPGDDKVKSSTDYAKPIYLVAPPLSGQSGQSFFMVEAAALADGAEPLHARTVAQIPGSRHGMSFVRTHSEQGSWIVGVGGKGGDTVIYDPNSMKTILGPELAYPKHKPILISLGSKVYAISRCPRVYADTKFDFEPWFLSLSFRKGVPRICGKDFRPWKILPSPPFFPCFLDPLEFRNPPTISISSYAAIGSHILFSPDCKETGTYAFHVVEKNWEKVCNDNLPFTDQAVALGGSLFAACCSIHNNFATAVAVFHISIKGSATLMSSAKLTTRLLSLHPVPSEGDPPLPLLCPTGKGSFCSIRLGSCSGFHEGNYRLPIVLTVFKIDNIEAVLTACQTEYTEAEDPLVRVHVQHQIQTCLLPRPFVLKNSHMLVIASISMDRELAGPFEGERSKKRPREETVSDVFVSRSLSATVGDRELTGSFEGERLKKRPRKETVSNIFEVSRGLSATVGMAQGNPTGRGAMPPSGISEAFVNNLHLDDHKLKGIIGMDPSVYLSLCRRNSSFVPEAYSPLYMVSFPDSSLPESSATREGPCQIAGLETEVEGKSFISLPSGWIIGVGGNSGGTIILDTKSPTEVIRGPNLLAAKCFPILAAVGHKVYALCNSPSYIDKLNFVPWFEVLDLSKGTITKTADGNFLLDGCLWEELPCPPCFCRKLSPTRYLHPPIISVRSYVIVLPYILLCLNPKTSCTFAFDTSSGDWHKIDNTSLPFVGHAKPHGHSGCIFLGTSLGNWSITAYRISVSTSSSSPSTVLGGSGGKGSAVKISITSCSIINEEHKRIGSVAGPGIISLDRGRFSLLTFSFDNRKHNMVSYSEDDATYSKKLFANLTTYHIENPALLEETRDQEKLWTVKREITVYKQWEQEFKFFSSYGFSSPPIPFALSI